MSLTSLPVVRAQLTEPEADSLRMLLERAVPQRGEDEDVALLGVVQVLLEVRDERVVPVEAVHVAAAIEVRRRRPLYVNPSSCGEKGQRVRF